MKPRPSGWFISSVEARALMHLPHAAQVLYVMVLRRHMDFSTGVVGKSYRLSFQAMRERTEVHRSRGSTRGGFSATTQQVRTMLAQLEGAGLIRPAGGEKLVFFLPLALPGAIRSNEEQRNEQHDEQRNEQHDEQRNEQRNEQHGKRSATAEKERVFPDFEVEEQRTEQRTEQHDEQHDEVVLFQRDEQHTSVISSVQQQQQRACAPADADSEGNFLMRPGWKPSKNLDYQLRISGIVDYSPAILIEFIHHWASPDHNVRLSQHEWESKFLNQVIRKTRSANMQIMQSAIRAEGRKVGGQANGTAASRFDEARQRVREAGYFDEPSPPIPGDFQVVAT